jgi:hypothetical protein
MSTKLIITEAQYNRLQQRLVETAFTSMVRRMKEDLDANYAPTENYVREGGEYDTIPMFKVNLDEELISPRALFEYMKNKYNMGEVFTQQVIRDWVDGAITDNFMLSKNVPLK